MRYEKPSLTKDVPTWVGDSTSWDCGLSAERAELEYFKKVVDNILENMTSEKAKEYIAVLRDMDQKLKAPSRKLEWEKLGPGMYALKKDLAYHMMTRYPIKLTKLSEEDGGGWLAELPDLPGCMSDGETKEEAFRNLNDAKETWLESALERGKEIPYPSRC